MTATETRDREGFIRIFDPFRDLEEVVELIEVAFGDRLDPAGRATLARMRRFARGGLLLQWLWAFLGRAAVAPGLVWVEEGRVVGNVSLRSARGGDGYLIGNVVVHPDWRGQGIARALMRSAIERLSKRGPRWVGLEVRADNEVARRLYESLDFREVGRTLHMLRPAGLAREERPRPADSVRRGRSSDADALVRLMRASVADEHRPLLELQESDYRPSWIEALGNWLKGEREVWWVVEGEGALRAAARAAQKTGRFPHQLEILIRPGEHGSEADLVTRALASLRGLLEKPVEALLPAPTDPLVAALRDAGFHKMRELIQMKRSFGRRIPVKVAKKKTGPL